MDFAPFFLIYLVTKKKKKKKPRDFAIGLHMMSKLGFQEITCHIKDLIQKNI